MPSPRNVIILIVVRRWLGEGPCRYCRRLCGVINKACYKFSFPFLSSFFLRPSYCKRSTIRICYFAHDFHGRQDQSTMSLTNIVWFLLSVQATAIYKNTTTSSSTSSSDISLSPSSPIALEASMTEGPCSPQLPDGWNNTAVDRALPITTPILMILRRFRSI